MVENTVPEGLIPPVLTPLTADHQVDVPAFKQLLQSLIDGGAAAVFVGGTAGLGSVLTAAEYERAVATALEVVPDDYPVLCGVLEPSTVRAAERIKLLESLNARYFVTVAPYFIRAMEYGPLERHFSYLREQTDMEMVAYNIPLCTGYSLPADLIIDMTERGWITCCKDSSGDEDYFKTLCVKGAEVGLKTYQGMRPDFPTLFNLGAAGCVPVPSNVSPDTFSAAWLSRGDAEKSKQLQVEVDTIWNDYVDGNDFISKSARALAEKGIGNGRMMLPFE